MVAALTSENNYLEASIDELVENGRAEVASSLGKIGESAY